MIKQIIPCINHARRIKKLGIQTKKPIVFSTGYNVLIGPNATGKTTLLDAIYSCNNCRIDIEKGTKIKYISTTKLSDINAIYLTPVERAIMCSRAMFSSAGQTARDMLSVQGYSGEDCILIDTPETDQDIKQSIAIYDRLKKLTRVGIQVIVATHSPFFIKENDNIIEFEKGYLDKIVTEYYNNLKRFMKK